MEGIWNFMDIQFINQEFAEIFVALFWYKKKKVHFISVDYKEIVMSPLSQRI